MGVVSASAAGGRRSECGRGRPSRDGSADVDADLDEPDWDCIGHEAHQPPEGDEEGLGLISRDEHVRSEERKREHEYSCDVEDDPHVGLGISTENARDMDQGDTQAHHHGHRECRHVRRLVCEKAFVHEVSCLSPA